MQQTPVIKQKNKPNINACKCTWCVYVTHSRTCLHVCCDLFFSSEEDVISQALEWHHHKVPASHNMSSCCLCYRTVCLSGLIVVHDLFLRVIWLFRSGERFGLMVTTT